MVLNKQGFGFRFQVRIHDLLSADVVEYTCVRCSKSYLLAPFRLLEMFPSHTHLDAVLEQFCCCSETANQTMRVGRFFGLSAQNCNNLLQLPIFCPFQRLR